MKTNELRINNLLNPLFSDINYCEVKGIDEDYIYSNVVSIDYTTCKDFEPITLTEEWLLNFGFYQREFSFDKGSFYLTKRTGKKEYLYQAHTKRFQVKYVHQLQNLYFALTGEELILK